jgi:hypothetical protein
MEDFVQNHMSHIGDILAIFLIFPFLICYFLLEKKDVYLERYLLVMAFVGLIADIIFTFIYLRYKPTKSDDKK